ncbi:hypothetical protein Pint_18153 [Pistacia integerrima]|uniref:Uncharacterized protein n=1 Tax=Pistacia integerrima TaxID=434235 RepID=A0ACC0YX43_9ROSI|nr:hypothetical protein Pint_18153 [Pistacia integerrima]
MAQIKLKSVCLILVLIFFQEIQCIEERDLKLVTQNDCRKLRAYNKILEKETRKLAEPERRNLSHGDENTILADANVSPSVAIDESALLNMTPPGQDVNGRPTVPGHS